MNKSAKLAQSIVGTSPGRNKVDFYCTPSPVTDSIICREAFSDKIWEPACGDGAISKVLESHGYDVISSDLYDRGFGKSGIDFLSVSREEYNSTYFRADIITNPPYSLINDFIKHCLNLECPKFAFLAKLSLLEGQKRYDILRNSGLRTVYVSKSRIKMVRDGSEYKNGGMIAFAWFVFEHRFSGKPVLDWF